LFALLLGPAILAVVAMLSAILVAAYNAIGWLGVFLTVLFLASSVGAAYRLMR